MGCDGQRLLRGFCYPQTIFTDWDFEIFSDHDSQYLYTQKSPSQQILRSCEVLTDYNFEEVQDVSSPQNVVPDFWSRPWEPTASADASLHVLMKRWPK